MVEIVINKEKCDACGECVDVCPSGVYEIKDEAAEPVNIEDCVECCACIDVCPNGAIEHSSC